MDYYHAMFDLKSGVRDTEFARHFTAFMDYLKARGVIEGWTLTRRKLGLGPDELREFHAVMEVRDLAQLDAAFTHVAERAEPAESAHFAVNSQVCNARFALYRDFPDKVRREGEEKF
jgi:hypothetical protein